MIGEGRGSWFRRPDVLAFIFFSMAALAFSFPGGALGQGYKPTKPEEREFPRYKLGALEIHPGAELSVEHDDNIFLSKNNTKSDTIYRFIPTINLKIPIGTASSGEVGFKYEAIDFVDYDNEDTENKTATFSLNLERIGGDFYSRTTGMFEDTSDPSSSEQQTTTGARTPRTKLEVDSAFGYGGYEGFKGRLEVKPGYTRERYDRSSNRRLNRKEGRFTVLGEYAISPKTSLRAEYGFQRGTFDDRSATDQKDDSRDHFVRGGLAFSPSALITGYATVGAEWRKYDHNLSATDTSDRDTTAWSADVDLTWQARPSRTSITLMVGTGIEDVTTPGEFGQRRTTVSMDVNQELFFISEGLNFKFSPSFERNDFIRSRRVDNLIGYMGELKYSSNWKNFPWFSALSYEYKRKTTNQNKSSVEYTDTTYLFKVGIQY